LRRWCTELMETINALARAVELRDLDQPCP
jgi:hypothetical protein